MSVVEYGGDVYALRSSLSIATTVPLNERFDDLVVSGVRRSPGWHELLSAYLRILAPAISCGACAMLLLMHLALQTPSASSFTVDKSSPASSVDLDKLMILLEKPGQSADTMALIQQSMVATSTITTTTGKTEQKAERRSSIGDTQSVV